MLKPECKSGYPRSSGPVHQRFGLTYAAYYTVPRLALQGMPIWWQKIFCWLVDMLPDTPEYTVQRRDERGKFIKDPWGDYRRGSVEQLIREQQDDERRAGWTLLSIDKGDTAATVDQNHQAVS